MQRSEAIYLDEAALVHFEPRTGLELARICMAIASYRNTIPNFAELTDPIFAALRQLRTANRHWKHVLLNERTGWTPAHNLRLVRFQAVVLEQREGEDYFDNVD
eukprot:GHVU01028459.1.p2 GENE.GHVU01028459.1~~GHVU01028459.1.p2  ORF type:complete len:104 (+),score=7.66 GHVU01028459.1:235-546(+)